MAGFAQRLILWIDANVTQAQSNLRSFQTTWTELLSAVTLGQQLFNAVGQGAREAFDFSAQGATVVQTAESFDILLEKVGAAPNLLQQLQDAAGGTISDLQLMSATSTLLAGAQGDVATSLANATPQLLEIARAANKLNPSLGSTAFLYESIATGIKRSSPLILDNLGLTIKIGEANDAYAASLGKSVDELTAQERQVALLNATLEAGDTLIQQVGGSVESATDDYNRFTAEVTNAKDALAAAFYETGLVQDATSNFAAGLTDVATIWSLYNQGTIDGAEALRLFRLQSVPTEENIAELSARLQELSTDYSQYLTPAVIEASREAASFDQAMINAGLAVDEAADAMEDATTTTDEFSGALNALEANLNLGGAIEKMIEQLEFASLGGLELQQQLEEAKQAYLDGDLDEAGLQATLQRAFVEAQDLQVLMGNITADEAAANIASTLNISLEAANALLNGIVDDINTLNGNTFTAFLNIHTAYSSTGAPPIFPGGLPPGIPVIPRQHGGPLDAGQLAIVGERGPELFVPRSSGDVISNQDLKDLLGGMGNGSVHVQVFLDGNEIGSAVSTRLAQMGRRAAANAGAFTGI